eukprot:753197-Hanusia_phi.AAC.2
MSLGIGVHKVNDSRKVLCSPRYLMTAEFRDEGRSVLHMRLLNAASVVRNGHEKPQEATFGAQVGGCSGLTSLELSREILLILHNFLASKLASVRWNSSTFKKEPW